ncbi:MAG: rRNA maturation RNase YbeY [Dehalococcoidales bacterium]|nr:rRNA maturation RNase YbeY [Dehalococcoidales bacterium]
MMGQYRADMEINVLIDDDLEGHLEASWLQGVAEQVLTARDIGSGVELGLVITGQERVRQLNRSYRGRDEPTDVLAFSTVEETGADFPPFVTPPDGVLHLGEVIIAYPQAVAQAEEHGHSIKKEIAILIIHGVLHLLGYDHEKPEMEREMRTKEREILNGIEGELQ